MIMLVMMMMMMMMMVIIIIIVITITIIIIKYYKIKNLISVCLPDMVKVTTKQVLIQEQIKDFDSGVPNQEFQKINTQEKC